jgi:endonuclease YncB( thermonuclease family)
MAIMSRISLRIPPARLATAVAVVSVMLLACDLPIPGLAPTPAATEPAITEVATELATIEVAAPTGTPPATVETATLSASATPQPSPTETATGGATPSTPEATASVPATQPTLASPPGEQVLVTRIVDGDTFKVMRNGSEISVRYIGINTPEVGQPCADEATAADQALIEGKTVTLVKDVSDTDQYGRLLRYVYVGVQFINAELVKQGWAEAAKYPPDVLHADEFAALAAAAKTQGLGCWPMGAFVGGGSGTPTAGTPGVVCDCSYNKYNCIDFNSRADAQACFDYCQSQGKGDVHQMDGNGNGLACENIP